MTFEDILYDDLINAYRESRLEEFCLLISEADESTKAAVGEELKLDLDDWQTKFLESGEKEVPEEKLKKPAKRVPYSKKEKKPQKKKRKHKKDWYDKKIKTAKGISKETWKLAKKYNLSAIGAKKFKKGYEATKLSKKRITLYETVRKQFQRAGKIVPSKFKLKNKNYKYKSVDLKKIKKSIKEMNKFLRNKKKKNYEF